MIASIKDRTVLNNGLEMPWLGFGVFKIPDGTEVEQAMGHAFEVGYRRFDTASVYGNEQGVGTALRECGIPRKDIFLTTKVWNDDLRAQRTLAAFEESLDRLQTDYVDLYLVHWPVEGFYKEAWQAMEELYQSGRARSIGVSNFMEHHLEDLLADCEVVPAVNQVEFHPYLLQPKLLSYNRSQGILVEAWSPLMRGQVLADPVIRSLAEKHQKTPAQIVLRWDLQHGVATIPKSVRPERILENSQLFDFELTQADMDALDSLDRGERSGPDPFDFDL